jgi:hypothetical protein
LLEIPDAGARMTIRGMRLLIVTGPGRSGTSLCAHLLSAAGAAEISDELLPASPQSPDGLYEDAEVTQIHKQLLAITYYRGVIPRPGDWLESAEVRKLYRELHATVANRLEAHTNGWLVKDPRISVLMPIWSRIIEANDLKPTYVFCVRGPPAMMASLHRAYGTSFEQAELVWLVRTVFFLRNVRSRVFFVRYEDWFRRPLKQFLGLARYARASRSIDELRQLARRIIIKPELNLSSPIKCSLALLESRRVAAALHDVRGATTDRRALNRVVDSVYEDYTRFPPLARMIHELAASISKGQNGDSSQPSAAHYGRASLAPPRRPNSRGTGTG